jgi:hypothetical protein
MSSRNDANSRWVWAAAKTMDKRWPALPEEKYPELAPLGRGPPASERWRKVELLSLWLGVSEEAGRRQARRPAGAFAVGKGRCGPLPAVCGGSSCVSDGHIQNDRVVSRRVLLHPRPRCKGCVVSFFAD